MMGTKGRNFRPPPNNVSLENLVPEDNFYRRLQAKLDLSFVRELVEDCYAASVRPSAEPEVFFRLQLVMFHEGIRSERELMRIVSDRLSVNQILYKTEPGTCSSCSMRTRCTDNKTGRQVLRRNERYVDIGSRDTVAPSPTRSTAQEPGRGGAVVQRSQELAWFTQVPSQEVGEG